MPLFQPGSRAAPIPTHMTRSSAVGRGGHARSTPLATPPVTKFNGHGNFPGLLYYSPHSVVYEGELYPTALHVFTRNGKHNEKNFDSNKYQTYRAQALLAQVWLEWRKTTAIQDRLSICNSRPLLSLLVQLHLDVSQGPAVEVGAMTFDDPFSLILCSSTPSI